MRKRLRRDGNGDGDKAESESESSGSDSESDSDSDSACDSDSDSEGTVGSGKEREWKGGVASCILSDLTHFCPLSCARFLPAEELVWVEKKPLKDDTEDVGPQPMAVAAAASVRMACEGLGFRIFSHSTLSTTHRCSSGHD